MKRLLLLAAAAVVPLCAQEAFEYWPGASYDPRIPDVQKVLGYDPGARISSHAEIMRYFETLAAAAPARLKLFPYAESWEGRKLIYAVIGSESNIKRLPEIRASIQRIADPRKTPEAEARKLMATLPAVVWLAYGVHGNEISSPDAAMLAAYHFIASRNDKVVEQILANALVIIDPTQNPDGRDRFVHHYEQARGLEPDENPSAVEHNESWPGGRTNHYHFDMNRDWFAATQPETRGRIAAMLQWYPLVAVDLHEMGSDATYYFAPSADPYNPHMGKDQVANMDLFGKNNAKWFDKFGFDYFTRDQFDGFYPGYGDSWPAFFGSVGMTYEQASVRGLVVRRADERLMRFRDTVRQHFIASISTAEAAAANRTKLLSDFYRYRAAAVEEGKTEAVREYILARGRDAAATDKLAGILVEQGVEVKRATAPFRAGDREYPAGTYVVPLAQPAKRLIRTLLDPQTAMDEKFVQKEEERRRRKLRTEIYDVTAWSLPLMFNVEAVARPEESKGTFEPAGPVRALAGEVHGKAGVAYLVPWGSQAAGRLLASALRQDLKVLSGDKGFTLNGRKFPSGSLIFKVSDNPGLHERLAKLAASTGADVWATDTSYVEEGVNFGSRYMARLRKPAVAMAWDTPTASSAAGATRFVLERQYGYPVTPIRTAQIGTADLGKFQVLILPPGSGYAQVLGPQGIERIKTWVQAGGTLVGLAEAVGFLAETRVGLLALTPENAAREGETPRRPEQGAAAPSTAQPAASAPGVPAGREAGAAPGKLFTSDADFAKAIQPDREPPDRVPGVLARARIDREQWIADGMGDSVCALVEGRAIYSPMKIDKGVNAVYFEAPDKLLASGYLWAENRKQLAYKPLVVVQPQGRGTVIGFTQDPSYRAYLDGMNVLFLNAVFRGPVHGRRFGGGAGE